MNPEMIIISGAVQSYQTWLALQIPMIIINAITNAHPCDWTENTTQIHYGILKIAEWDCRLSKT